MRATRRSLPPWPTLCRAQDCRRAICHRGFCLKRRNALTVPRRKVLPLLLLRQLQLCTQAPWSSSSASCLLESNQDGDDCCCVLAKRLRATAQRLCRVLFGVQRERGRLVYLKPVGCAQVHQVKVLVLVCAAPRLENQSENPPPGFVRRREFDVKKRESCRGCTTTYKDILGEISGRSKAANHQARVGVASGVDTTARFIRVESSGFIYSARRKFCLVGDISATNHDTYRYGCDHDRPVYVSKLYIRRLVRRKSEGALLFRYVNTLSYMFIYGAARFFGATRPRAISQKLLEKGAGKKSPNP